MTNFLNKQSNILMIFIFLPFSEQALLFGDSLQASNSKTVPIEIACGNYLVTVPFQKLISSNFYPSFLAGTEFLYRNGRFVNMIQTFGVGYYYHRYAMQGWFCNSNLTFRLNTKMGLFTDIGMGPGAALLFYPQAVYELDNGEYKQVKDNGYVCGLVTLPVSIGYNFYKKSKFPGMLFMRYQFSVLFLNGDLSLFPQTMLQIGYRHEIGKRSDR